ncbi:MAG: fluoride exporter [Kribbellaceae bacterium]|jgi:CrcB protein|nr:fluoride exporter [Kribbellaceae bacterium]
MSDTRFHPTGPQVLGAIALGGAIGALARYGVGRALPHRSGAFPWSTFLINVSGCLLIGVLLVMITEVRTVHPLSRPFLGTGVLGGFTTFSTFAVDTEQLLGDHPLTAVAYFFGTVAAALLAVQTGVTVTRRLTLPRGASR